MSGAIFVLSHWSAAASVPSCVIESIWYDERKVGKSSAAQIRRELREWHDVASLRGFLDIRKISERIVMSEIGINIAAQISGVGQTLCVTAPGFIGLHQLADNVVVFYGAGK